MCVCAQHSQPYQVIYGSINQEQTQHHQVLNYVASRGFQNALSQDNKTEGRTHINLANC